MAWFLNQSADSSHIPSRIIILFRYFLRFNEAMQGLVASWFRLRPALHLIVSSFLYFFPLDAWLSSSDQYEIDLKAFSS